MPRRRCPRHRRVCGDVGGDSCPCRGHDPIGRLQRKQCLFVGCEFDPMRGLGRLFSRPAGFHRERVIQAGEGEEDRAPNSLFGIVTRLRRLETIGNRSATSSSGLILSVWPKLNQLMTTAEVPAGYRSNPNSSRRGFSVAEEVHSAT
jgi:hypothetical protein